MAFFNRLLKLLPKITSRLTSKKSSKVKQSKGAGLWPDELDGQAEVSDAAGAVPLHQDVFALQVSVGDGRFALRAEDLRVKVAEAGDGWVGQSQHGPAVQGGALQIVVQRAVLVVVGDEVELSPRARAFNVGRYKPWRES